MSNLPTYSRPGSAARGFSLLELMLVLAIIGLLTAVAAYSLSGQGERARLRTTWTTMQMVKNAIQQYELNSAAMPPSLEVLQTGPYAILDPGKPLIDGWKRAYFYSPQPTRPNTKFDLFSVGPDGQFGTPDDIDIHNPPPEVQ